MDKANIGHNNPPITEEIHLRHKDVFDSLDQLAGADALVPAVITNDDEEGKAQDVVMKCKKTVKMAEAMYKLEKAPFDQKLKEIKATFAIPIEKVEKVSSEVLRRLDDYKAEKAAAERRRREDEARKAREEQEAREAAAREAEKKRAEAEAARRAEEERAARAQAEKERAEREAREARERAERLKEEEARLKKEAEERKKREEAEAAARAERDAKAEEERKARMEAEQKKLAELRAQREEEERKAKEAREARAKALEEQRAAEDAARMAKKEEKAADREVNAELESAERFEKRADKLDGAARESASELSRGRGDYGSVGSLATFWTWSMIDREKIPLEQLRPFILPDAIDAAVTKFMNANRPQLGKGRDHDDLLPGVSFHTETKTRVA
jgi:chromosome segregation ATPase